MNIVVCMKQVPDTTEVRLDPETGTLIRKGVPSIINPDDKSGLEAALQLKDQEGARVIALSMGPPQAEKALREALAMGADEAVLLSDRAFGGADTWATSYTLAAALRRLSWDLIITGRQAIDGDTAQVGPQIAEHLGLPQVSYAARIERQENSLIIRRMYEDRYQTLRVQLPCLVTALSEMNTPRYMSVAGIREAYNEKTVEVWDRETLGLTDKSVLGLKGSPTRVKKSFTKGARAAGRKVETDPQEGARIIMEELQERFIIEQGANHG